DLTSLLNGAPPGMPRAFRRRRRAGSRALIGVQIAVSFLVVAVAGLFAATLANLEHANRGFNPRHLLVFRVDASAYGFSNRALASFSDRLLRRIEALPGVSAASASTTPLASSVINGEQITVPGRPTLVAPVNGVAPGFFNVIGDHLAAGRDFSRGDLASGRRVAVVNQAFARWLFSGRDPLGARFNIGLPVTPGLAYTIVGVADDVRYRGPAAPGPDWPFFYVLYSQVPSTLAMAQGGIHFEVRTAVPPASLVRPVRSLVASLAPGLAIEGVQTPAGQIAASLAKQRIAAYLAGYLAAFALLLAVASVYAVEAYASTQRRRETGIRLALGAPRSSLLAAQLLGAAWPAVAGVAAGAVGAWLLARLVVNQLFGVAPLDPGILALAAGLLVIAALAGALFPAVGAANTPVAALVREP
ncbi:MAG: ABC transporter permease, partial [Terriglobales bacterium]